MLSHQLILDESLSEDAFTEDDIMFILEVWWPVSSKSAADRAVRSWDTQNGCSETNIVRRMMELPLKLMTLLTVTISKSSTTSFGPLIGRVKTSVALTLLVCCQIEETETEEGCEEQCTGNSEIWQLHMAGKILGSVPRYIILQLVNTCKKSRKVYVFSMVHEVRSALV